MTSPVKISRPGDPAARTLFTALDAMPTPIIAVTSTGTINYVNPEAVRTFGYPADELIGEPVEILIPAGDTPVHARLREDLRSLPGPIAGALARGHRL